MSKQIRAYEIRYDTDGKRVKLPKELTFEVDDDFDAAERVCDLISDKTGYCIFGCQWENVK